MGRLKLGPNAIPLEKRNTQVVEVIKEIEKPVEVIKVEVLEKEIIKEVKVPVYVDKPVYIDRIVPVEVTKEIQVPVEVIKEVIKEVQVPVKVEVTKIINKIPLAFKIAMVLETLLLIYLLIRL